jgi:SAM-dependent methyltransferase
VTDCPVCLHSDFDEILARERVPVLQNVIVSTAEEARAFPVARLRIVRCRHCSFVWNADFDPDAIDYNLQYNNSVQASQVYLDHQKAMAERVLSRPGRLSCLEVGCGEGEFLNALSASGRLDKAVGFDPAHKGLYPLADNIEIVRAYFDGEAALKLPGDINLVVSRHTIEHIPAPRPFIEAIANYVRERRLPLFLETPDVSWILENNAFEDFFYEHCSLFSPRSMQVLLAAYGLKAKVEAVYGGQYMWVEAEDAGSADIDLPPADADAGRAARGVAEALRYWQGKVSDLGRNGPVAVWGGASKGVTFSLLIDGVDCAIDLNRSKQGCFMPVSAVPILSPEDALARGVRSIIVMNPNYRNEIRRQLDSMGFDGELLVLQDAG